MPELKYSLALIISLARCLVLVSVLLWVLNILDDFYVRVFDAVTISLLFTSILMFMFVFVFVCARSSSVPVKVLMFIDSKN